MITERATKEYYVSCNTCGRRAAQGLSKQEARDLAQEAGFRHWQKWNGLEYIQRDFCPECYENFGLAGGDAKGGEWV